MKSDEKCLYYFLNSNALDVEVEQWLSMMMSVLVVLWLVKGNMPMEQNIVKFHYED